MAALLMLCSTVSAQDVLKSKKKLIEENRQLTLQVDSLKRLLEHKDTVILTNIAVAEAEAAAEASESEEDRLYLSAEDIDNRIGLWALEQSNNYTFEENCEEFTPGASDEEYMKRLEAMSPFFTLPYNKTVRSYIVLYSEHRQDQMSRMLGLGRYYMPIFEEAFDRYGLPHELKALAIVESSLNPRAVSKVGAKGLWQFMYAAAKGYGLTIDSFIDERFDPYKCSDAAARYLRDAYKVFGDWALAICSYNCGYGGVKKAIARAEGKTGFWDIYPFLPAETRNYLPAMVGVMYTMHYRNELGIKPTPCSLPYQVDSIVLNSRIHFQQISDNLDVELSELKNLNPQYLHNIIPADGKPHTLRLPGNITSAYLAQADSIAAYKADEFFAPAVIQSIKDFSTPNRIVYVVKSGDNLSIIARKYGVTVKKIQAWNNLKTTVIKPKQKLVIYK